MFLKIKKYCSKDYFDNTLIQNKGFIFKESEDHVNLLCLHQDQKIEYDY